MNPGRVVGAYEVVALLGKGAMGAVYRARHRQLGVERALKMIPYGRDATRRARFAREARSLAAISHEHVVRIHEAGEQAGEVYLVMDLVEGESLERTLERGRWPIARGLEVVCALARGVAALHAIGIIHRDLKPENVLVRADGAPVIVDLGLAVAPDTDERLTRTGAMIGTPIFMAPEQLLGRPASSAADVYALGLIAFVAATGQRATRPVESIPELIAEVTLEDRPLPSTIDPDLPAALDGLMARMLAREPERRPRAVEVVRDVEAMLTALRADTSESARAVGRRRMRRRVLVLMLVLALVLVLVLVLGHEHGSLTQSDEHDRSVVTSATPPPTRVDDPEATRQLRRLERLADPVARLDAVREWLARWPEHGERAAARVVERGARVHVPLRLACPADTIGAAFLDDARVVTVSGDQLRVWDADTGAELAPLASIPPTTHTTLVVLRDGAGLLTTHDAQVLHHAPGQPVSRTAVPHFVFSLTASPDGETLVAGHDEGVATVLSRRDGRTVATLAGHGHAVWSAALSPDGRWVVTGTGIGVDHQGGTDNSIRVWSLERGGELVRREPLDARATCIAFVPGSDSFLVGHTGARVYRFVLDQPGPVQELVSEASLRSDDMVLKSPAHRGGLRTLVLSKDGRRVWTGSGGAGPRENELRAWDVETGRERYRLLDRPTGYRTVRLSPDERRLVTWSDEGVVEVWATDP